MLLPIKTTTKRGAIFSALNKELLYFLGQACAANSFQRTLFSKKLGGKIWANEPTREKFHGLWREFNKYSISGRHAIFASLQQCQNIGNYYSNSKSSPIHIPRHLSNAIGEVTTHLFSRTSKLRAVEVHCRQTLDQYFQHFCKKNKNVCCICGTEVLAQYRADIETADQWRGPFDHILAKEKYPSFGIHPDNLLPICSTCNGKAKLAKDILHDSNGERRRSFNPYAESVHQEVGVKILQTNTGLCARTFFKTGNQICYEKLKTWDEVYRIRQRVDGWFLTLLVLIDTDCCPTDLNSLKAMIATKAGKYRKSVRHAPWNLWKHKLYYWLQTDSPAHIDLLWTAIAAHRDDPNFAQEFGI